MKMTFVLEGDLSSSDWAWVRSLMKEMVMDTIPLEVMDSIGEKITVHVEE